MPSSHDFKKDKRNNSIKININGKFFPRKKAKISVFDSEIIFSKKSCFYCNSYERWLTSTISSMGKF